MHRIIQEKNMVNRLSHVERFSEVVALPFLSKVEKDIGKLKVPCLIYYIIIHIAFAINFTFEQLKFLN